jgi:hypothetical protein
MVCDYVVICACACVLVAYLCNSHECLYACMPVMQYAVCLYMCVFMHIYTYIYIHIYIYIYIYLYIMSMYVCVYLHMYALCACTRMREHGCECVFVCRT